MAEKDEKAGGSAPSDKKNVTDDITRSLKEAGQKAAELAQNPVARNMFAAGLVTAAAALTANKKFRGGVKDAGKNAQQAAGNTADNASKIGAAIIGAATDAVRRLLSGAKDVTEETIVSTPPKKKATGKKAAKKNGGTKSASGSTAKAASAKPATTASKPAARKASAAKASAPSSAAATTSETAPKPRSRAKAAPKAASSETTTKAAAPAPKKAPARKTGGTASKPASRASRPKKAAAPATEGNAS